MSMDTDFAIKLLSVILIILFISCMYLYNKIKRLEKIADVNMQLLLMDSQVTTMIGKILKDKGIISEKDMSDYMDDIIKNIKTVK